MGVNTPVETLTLGNAKRSFLMQCQQLHQQYHELGGMDVSLMSEEEAAFRTRTLLMMHHTLEATVDRIEELEGQ